MFYVNALCFIDCEKELNSCFKLDSLRTFFMLYCLCTCTRTLFISCLTCFMLYFVSTCFMLYCLYTCIMLYCVYMCSMFYCLWKGFVACVPTFTLLSVLMLLCLIFGTHALCFASCIPALYSIACIPSLCFIAYIMLPLIGKPLQLNRPFEVASRGYSFVISFWKALALHEFIFSKLINLFFFSDRILPFCIREVWIITSCLDLTAAHYSNGLVGPEIEEEYYRVRGQLYSLCRAKVKWL